MGSIALATSSKELLVNKADVMSRSFLKTSPKAGFFCFVSRLDPFLVHRGGGYRLLSKALICVATGFLYRNGKKVCLEKYEKMI